MRLNSPVTYRMVEYLLSHPHTSQVEIARNTGASRNLVNHVVKELEAPGIVAQKSRMRLELADSIRLLEILSIQRPLSKLEVTEVRTEESEPSEVERVIREVSVHDGIDYALTTFSALTKYIEYYLSYSTVHVYCNESSQLMSRLVPGKGDVKVVVLRPDSELILKHARSKRGATLVAPIQAVVDTFCLGGAGRDGAIKLYNQELTKEQKLEKITPGQSFAQRTA